MRINSVIGFQQFTSNALTAAVSCSTALLIDAQGQKANAAYFSVGGSSGSIRYRDDGTAPTSNIGLRLSSGGTPFLYQGDLYKVKFITDFVPGHADLSITYLQVAD